MSWAPVNLTNMSLRIRRGYKVPSAGAPASEHVQTIYYYFNCLVPDPTRGLWVAWNRRGRRVMEGQCEINAIICIVWEMCMYLEFRTMNSIRVSMEHPYTNERTVKYMGHKEQLYVTIANGTAPVLELVGCTQVIVAGTYWSIGCVRIRNIDHTLKM